MQRACKTCSEIVPVGEFPARSLDCRNCRNLWRKIHHRAACTGNKVSLKAYKKEERTRRQLMDASLVSQVEGRWFDFSRYVQESPPPGISETGIETDEYDEDIIE